MGLSGRHRRTCERCRERGHTRKWLIDVAQGNTPRNRLEICEACAAAVERGWITPAQLQEIADEREDRETRDLMSHAAFRRDGGAVRQIRDR